MFATVLTQVTGLFASGQEFARTYFFPLLLWSAGIAMLAMGSVDAVELRLAAFAILSGPLQVGVVVAWLGLVALLASILAGMRLSVLRLFEGNWSAWAGPVHRRLVSRHAAAVAANSSIATKAVLGRYYDHPSQQETTGLDGLPVSRRVDLLPTRLGNMLRAAEDYPSRRYGMDGVLLWPRLVQVLPEGFRTELDEAQRGIDGALVSVLLAGSFGLLGGALAMRAAVPWWAFAALWFGSWSLALLGYRSALAAALPYTELVRSAFDLHRADLLTALGFADADAAVDVRRPMEARELWRTISTFVLQGTEAFPRRPWPVPPEPPSRPTPTTGRLVVRRRGDVFVGDVTLQDRR